MGSLLSYSVFVSILLVPLYVIYRTVLSSTTLLSFNRAVLISIYAVALLLPPVLPLLSHVGAQSGVVGLEIGEMTVAIASVADTGSGWNWYRAVVWCYTFGVAVLACRFIVTLGGLMWLIARGDKCRADGYVVVRHGRKGIVPFSWCRWIFIPVGDNYADSIVIAHEAAHLARHHWVDLLVAELVLIIDWYNPAAWQMRDSLQDIHEFQADADVLAGGVDARTYQMFLIKKTVGDRFHALTDSLNHSSLKKRITMMLSRKTRSSARLRAMALVPALALGALVIDLPAVASVTEALGSTELAVPDAQPAPAMEPVVGKDTKNSDDAAVFSQVEQMPEFPGGDKALMKYVMDNVRFPKEAEGLSGRVVVKFVVEKDGSIGDVEVIRGKHPAFDKEAVRVVKSLPAFKPGMVDGKAVAVYYTLPISFASTGGTEAKTTAPRKSAEQMPEFPGGDKALMQFVAENIKVPEVGADAPSRLMAVVRFTVSATGKVCDPQIIRSTGNDACDAEALRVVGIIPDFTPGKVDGKPVAVEYTLPFTFAWTGSDDTPATGKK